MSSLIIEYFFQAHRILQSVGPGGLEGIRVIVQEVCSFFDQGPQPTAVLFGLFGAGLCGLYPLPNSRFLDYIKWVSIS